MTLPCLLKFLKWSAKHGKLSTILEKVSASEFFLLVRHKFQALKSLFSEVLFLQKTVLKMLKRRNPLSLMKFKITELT
jgi:hypothetical protein